VQTLAAYLSFLLVVIVVGLGIIFGTIVGLLTYEGIAWMKSRQKLRFWERSVIGAFVLVRPGIEDAFGILGRSIRVQIFHVNQWMKQPL
jgi:hypothetical protein